MAKRKYVKENNLVKAINTDSLELQKPLANEYYDINVHNSNMDKIDTGYKQNKNDILNIIEVTNNMGSEIEVLKDKVSSLDDEDIPIQYLNGWEGSLTCKVNGKCVTLTGMLHGQDVAIKSARTNILKLPINSKSINITAIGLYNAFGQYVGTVELTLDNEIKISNSDFTYNGNYIGLNLSWFLH